MTLALEWGGGRAGPRAHAKRSKKRAGSRKLLNSTLIRALVVLLASLVFLSWLLQKNLTSNTPPCGTVSLGNIKMQKRLTKLSKHSATYKKRFLWNGFISSVMNASLSANGESKRRSRHSQGVGSNQERHESLAFLNDIPASSSGSLQDWILSEPNVSIGQQSKTILTSLKRCSRTSTSHGKMSGIWTRRGVSVEEEGKDQLKSTLYHETDGPAIVPRATTWNSLPSLNAPMQKGPQLNLALCFLVLSSNASGWKYMMTSSKSLVRKLNNE